MIDLSIVIPTYNRLNWIEGRMVSLELLLAGKGIAFEIIISDNHSNPSVESYYPEFNSRGNTTIIKPERHLQKAEENLFFALDYCRGEFVWILGDDDIPCRSGIDTMVSMIKSNKYDLMVFDSNRFLVNGSMINGNLAYSNPEDLESVGDFVRKFGFWFTIAGFSNSVFRKPTAEQIQLSQEILEVSPIYSHVIWLVAVQVRNKASRDLFREPTRSRYIRRVAETRSQQWGFCDILLDARVRAADEISSRQGRNPGRVAV